VVQGDGAASYLNGNDTGRPGRNLAASGEITWPSVGRNLAAYGEFYVAADNTPRDLVTRCPGVSCFCTSVGALNPCLWMSQKAPLSCLGEEGFGKNAAHKAKDLCMNQQNTHRRIALITDRGS
jgi:hypothetical protein